MGNHKKNDTVDAVIMASGASSRFGGKNKLLANFRGKPLARNTLELAVGCGLFNRIFFVACSAEVAALAEDLPVTLIRNSQSDLGQSESIRLGAAASEADHIIFLSCDQPLLDRATLECITGARKEGFIVEPRVNGEAFGPCVFSRVFREELCALPPGGMGRDVKKRHSARIIAVEIKDPERLLDTDNPEALAKVIALSETL
ncbi:MAG: nucleotidyltransferase family protein [Treponema sp.]|jgi:molybdenum cofactor cytidylyltransferase|nr:nucleotidyltransferase family protein [Treponema sp.]